MKIRNKIILLFIVINLASIKVWSLSTGTTTKKAAATTTTKAAKTTEAKTTAAGTVTTAAAATTTTTATTTTAAAATTAAATTTATKTTGSGAAATTTTKPTQTAGSTVPSSETSKSPTDANFGGYEVRPGQYPFMVYVQVPMITPNQKQMVPCVGVILSSIHVLYEAACAAALDIKTDKVYLLRDGMPPERTVKGFAISKVQTHPKFDFMNINSNIKVPSGANLAILTLADNLELNNNGLSFVHLPDKPIDKPVNITVVSFGFNIQANYSPSLRYYNVEMLDTETCKKDQASEYTNLAETGFLCSRAQKFDSSIGMEGPALIVGSSPANHSIIGVYNTRLRDKPKPGMIYGVWTSVMDYIDWIKSIIQS